MKHKRCIALFILIIASVLLCACGSSMAEAEVSGITMKEALQIANEYAKQWEEDAALISVTSSDNQDTELSSNGYEGKRNCWLFSYKSNLNLKQYSFYVLNGKIYDARESAFGYYAPIPESFISIDSDEAYVMAVDRGMSGGVNWAWGYHYTLQYCQDAATMEITPVFSVRGIDKNEDEMILNIDPITGEEIEILLKTGYNENGMSIWESRPIRETNETIDESKTLSRQEIQDKYKIWNHAEEFHVLPEELTDTTIIGIQSGRFSPYSDITVYAEEEWEAMMESLYGEF